MKIPNPVGHTATELQEAWIKELRAMADTNHRLRKELDAAQSVIADLRSRIAALISKVK